MENLIVVEGFMSRSEGSVHYTVECKTSAGCRRRLCDTHAEAMDWALTWFSEFPGLDVLDRTKDDAVLFACA